MSRLGLKLGAVAADFVGEQIGSWGFVAFQSCCILIWICWNVFAPFKPDPAPFIGLNLLLSLQAAYTGPVLLISANRQAASDRRRLAAIEHEVKHLRLQIHLIMQHFEIKPPQ